MRFGDGSSVRGELCLVLKEAVLLGFGDSGSEELRWTRCRRWLPNTELDHGALCEGV